MSKHKRIIVDVEVDDNMTSEELQAESKKKLDHVGNIKDTSVTDIEGISEAGDNKPRLLMEDM